MNFYVMNIRVSSVVCDFVINLQINQTKPTNNWLKLLHTLIIFYHKSSNQKTVRI